MNSAVKAIKHTLCMEYPESVVSVRIKRARNYVDSSDKLEVYVSGVTYADVRTTLVHYTRNMAICKTGQSAACFGGSAPTAWDAAANQFVDAEMCEFIEVKTDSAE